MDKFEVGDQVVRTCWDNGSLAPIGTRAVVVSVNGPWIWVNLDVPGELPKEQWWNTAYAELAPPPVYLFKVGDKGRTREGNEYEVIAVYDQCFAPLRKQLAVLIDGYLCRREVDGRYAYNQERNRGDDLLPPPTYVYRIELTGVKSPNRAGLLDMQSTRYYATEENALAGMDRGRQAYAVVTGPFKEEKKA